MDVGSIVVKYSCIPIFGHKQYNPLVTILSLPLQMGYCIYTRDGWVDVYNIDIMYMYMYMKLGSRPSDLCKHFVHIKIMSDIKIFLESKFFILLLD